MASIAFDSFVVLAGEHPAEVYRRRLDVDDLPVSPALWMEDTVDRRWVDETQRTIRTGTLTIPGSVDFAETDKWVVNGEEWQRDHLSTLDIDLREIHLRRDDKLVTGAGSSRRF